MGRRGVNSSFKLLLPVFATWRGRGEGIRAVWLATPLLMSAILYFWEMSGFEAVSCRSKQVRYNLATDPPIFLIRLLVVQGIFFDRNSWCSVNRKGLPKYLLRCSNCLAGSSRENRLLERSPLESISLTGQLSSYIRFTRRRSSSRFTCNCVPTLHVELT